MSGSFRSERMPLRENAGSIPVLGFGTLIADLEATRIATGNALEADSLLRSRFKDNPLFSSLYGGYFSVWPNTFCINAGTDSAYCPLAPLGWQISVPSLRRLEGSFTIDKLGQNPEGVLRILQVEGLR